MGHSLRISHPDAAIKTSVSLPASKSESNRALILRELSGGRTELVNLSAADDTVLLEKLLKRGGKTADVRDCGTCLRFLIACYCIRNKNKIVTGLPRLCERPVGGLVDALQHLGFKLHYLREAGHPPVEVIPVETQLLKNNVTVDARESSQYLSALAMVAPLLDGGLDLEIKGPMASRPYLELTLHMLQLFGVSHRWKGKHLVIAHQPFTPPKELRLEADWSAAACWYSMACLAREAEIALPGLSPGSYQGDKVLMNWMQAFGVETTVNDGVVRIRKAGLPVSAEMKFDFTDHPDLALAVVVTAAALNVPLQITGIDNLRLKESDRLEGLMTELRKVNAWLEPAGDGFSLKSNFRPPREKIESYNDHRMAMAFAPLALQGEVSIAQPQCVSKSYPAFWDDLRKAGFVC